MYIRQSTHIHIYIIFMFIETFIYSEVERYVTKKNNNRRVIQGFGVAGVEGKVIYISYIYIHREP